jgi:hypothetical protein
MWTQFFHYLGNSEQIRWKVIILRRLSKLYLMFAFLLHSFFPNGVPIDYKYIFMARPFFAAALIYVQLAGLATLKVPSGQIRSV